MTGPDAPDPAATHAVELELLRGQVISCRARLAAQTRAYQRATAALQQYLETLFPHVFPQALAQGLSVVETADYCYQHHLHGADPHQLFGSAPAPAATPATVVAAPGVDLSADAVKLLFAAGLYVLATDIKALWAHLTGKAASTARNTVFPELLDKGLLRVEQIPVPRYLTGYASDTCYLLTDAGRAEYQRRFNAEAITYAAAYAPHKSPEAWWQIRALQALVLAGNTLPGNPRFTYAVYDPTGAPEPAAEAGFQRRYGHSEPDLIVVINSLTQGQPSRIAVESERGTYNPTRLKAKLLKNLADYGAAGFSGCYYIANNGDTASSIAGALSKLRADLKAHPEAVPTRGFLALFTLDALKDAWLPTPHFIDAEFFDRQARRVSDRWPADAARPERYFRFAPKGKDEG